MTINSKPLNQPEMFFSLDDLVSKDNIVRTIDAIFKYLTALDPLAYKIRGLQKTGRPAYPAEALLKIYFYGCINRIQSSRRLEAETKRNIEMIWLIGNLQPDHKTISDFRKDYGNVIKRFNQDVKKMLKDFLLAGSITVATDGTKLKANASKEMIAKVDCLVMLKRYESEYDNYIKLLDEQESIEEKTDEDVLKIKSDYEARMLELQTEITELKSHISLMESNHHNYLSKTDHDCNMMKSRDGMIPGYNVQVTVDSDHHLILGESVTAAANDMNQLISAQVGLREELDIIPSEHLADTGYCNMDDIERIEANDGTECFIPVPKEQGKTDDITFKYDKEKDQYICSQGKALALRSRNKKAKKSFVNVYEGKSCKDCPLMSQCTKSKTGRYISRFANQDFRDNFRKKSKSDYARQKSVQRKSRIEHVFGTMKLWLGKIPVLTRGLEAVETEIEIFSVAYNIKRLSNIMPLDELLRLMAEKEASRVVFFDIGAVVGLWRAVTATFSGLFKNRKIPISDLQMLFT